MPLEDRTTPPSPSSVLELRQYTLRPGAREVLIDLFERELIEPQEAVGCRVLGHFRDLDDPDRFVWLRGFDGMGARRRALTAFYGGPVWGRHRDAANATMIDSDDVLLLRPVPVAGGFAPLARQRPAASAPARSGALLLTAYFFSAAAGDGERLRFATAFAAAVVAAGTRLLGMLETEPAENDFPRLPVRTGENVLVALAAAPSRAGLGALEDRVGRAEREAAPFTQGFAQARHMLRLEPCARSVLP